MLLTTFIEKGFEIDLSAPQWDRVVKRFEVTHDIPFGEMECDDGKKCKIGYEDMHGRTLVTPTLGLMISTNTGLLILCPSEDNIPIATLIPKSDMQVVGIENKLFNTVISLTTKAGRYLFVVNKYKAYEYEQLINDIKDKI